MRIAAVSIAVLLLSSCSNNGVEQVSTTSESILAASVCPETIKIQTDQAPSAEMGFLYQLFSSKYTVNSVDQTVTGDINSGITDLASSQLQIRHGGASTKYEKVSSLLHSNSEFLAGLVDTDEAVDLAQVFPTKALFAPFQKSPDIIYWNPEQYPTAKTIADHNSWDVRVIYADGAYFMDHLTKTKQLKPTQPVNTFDGTPIPFLASAGVMLQQGLSTIDPYAYRNVYRDWMKEIAYQYIHDAGWTPYANSFSATPSQISKHSKCFEILIPALQNAQINFFSSPENSIARIVDTVAQFDGYWQYSASQARAAVEIMRRDLLVANGDDNVLGTFNNERVKALMESFYFSRNEPQTQNIAASEFFTNEFLDTSVAFE